MSNICDWYGGNDFMECRACGLEYDYRKSSRPACGVRVTLDTLKSEVDALHARVEAMWDRAVGPREPEDPCECGAMTAVNCGELPSLRHCGKWDV